MSKKLVAYFSATGVTAGISRQISETLGADLYEIKPKIPYTTADLDWRNSKSRSTIEMKDKTFRPEIEVDSLDISGYDTILLGFPIWWYVAPTVINTFLEAYDFSGKTVVIYATSGGSGFGNTIKELQTSVSETTSIVEGKILNGTYTNSQLASVFDGVSD